MGGCGSGVEPATGYRKVAGSSPLSQLPIKACAAKAREGSPLLCTNNQPTNHRKREVPQSHSNNGSVNVGNLTKAACSTILLSDITIQFM